MDELEAVLEADFAAMKGMAFAMNAIAEGHSFSLFRNAPNETEEEDEERDIEAENATPQTEEEWRKESLAEIARHGGGG